MDLVKEYLLTGIGMDLVKEHLLTGTSYDAYLATGIVSVIPILFLLLVPVGSSGVGEARQKKKGKISFMKVLLSFAVGGLLGDVFLHLIPHSFVPHDHSHSHSHSHSNSLSLVELCKELQIHDRSPAVVDYPTDAAPEYIHPPLPPSPHETYLIGQKKHNDDHDHQHHNHHEHEHKHDHHDHHHHHHHHDHGHDHHHHDDHHHDHGHDHHHHGHGHDHHRHDGHGHSHGEQEGMNHLMIGLLILAGFYTFFMVEKLVRLATSGGHSHSHPHSSTPSEASPTKAKGKKTQDEAPRKQGETSVAAASDDHAISLRVGGILNLIADLAHNFTDGMAIAASFLVSPQVGWSTTLAVFIHEIPHELGDFAILIRSGYSKKAVLALQFMTAIGALLGTFFGLNAAAVGANQVSWIIPFTAGGFIYVAAVDILPDLLHDSSLLQTILESLGFSCGIGAMLFISFLEEHDH